MNTVIIKEDEIYLNSSLSELSFGRTNYFTLIHEKGKIYCDKDDSFTDFTFDGVNEKTIEEDKALVYYVAKNPLSSSSKTLYSFFIDKEKNDELYNASLLVIKAITKALKSDTILPLVGGEGIIIDLENSKVLFLPEEIFKYSTNILEDSEYFNKESGWLNNTIKDNSAMSYERALITYRLLTSSFPYKEIDEEKRNADILDKNFAPLENIISNINIDFAKAIDKALMLNSTTVAIPGKKVKGVDSSTLTIDKTYDFDSLEKAWNETKDIKNEEYENKINEYINQKKKKIDAQRKLRRNRTAFIIALIIFVIVILFSVSEVKRQNAMFTTKGLTSTEIIQNFFYGVNNKSLEVLETISNGSSPDKYVGKITEVFLTEKQISGFTKEAPFFYPEKWLYTITNNDRYNAAKVFGITNLNIDGKDYITPNNTLYRKNENPITVTDDNGKEIMQNQTVTHSVSYYFVQTDLATKNILVSEVNENHTLTFKNGKWLLTDIESNPSPINVDTEEFKKDYFTALEKYDGNIVTSVSSLKEKYNWLPSEDSLIIEGANQF